MTFLLVCALCTSSPTPALAFETNLVPPTGASTFTADLGVLPVAPSGPQLRLDQEETSGSHGGHGNESHMGPMWVVMGVMMVAMMATVGIVMVRGGSNGRAHPLDAGPEGGAASPGLALRFGAPSPGR